MRVIVIDPCRACAEGLAAWLRAADYAAILLQKVEEVQSLLTQQSAGEQLFVIGPTTPTHEAFALCHTLQSDGNDQAKARSKIIIISPDAEDFTLQCDAVYVGVSAWLPIHITSEAFIETVALVSKGSSLMAHEVLAQAFLPIGLTPIELDVLKVMAEGKTDTQIASILHKGHQTVRTQVKMIFEKLQVNTRQKAIHRAKLRGLV